MTLSDLWEKDFLQVSKAEPVPYPDELFSAYTRQLGRFSKRDCRYAVRAAQVTDKGTAQTYTAFYTSEDDCDGGNSYGVIVMGDEADPRRAVATIQDTNLYCLESP